MDHSQFTLAALQADAPPRPDAAGHWQSKAALRRACADALTDLDIAPDADLDVFWVPGRVEVLGKHTDYAGGHSLLIASDQGFIMAAAARPDNVVRIRAAQRHETATFAVTPELMPQMGTWSNYPMTVARRLARNFTAPPLRGADIAFAGDLPPAAGMSSSSALMIATYLVLATVNQLDQHPAYRAAITTPLQLAEYLGTVENGQSYGPLPGDKGVGTFGGSEDHTAILTCKPGVISRYAFAPSRFEVDAPAPADHVFAIGVSGVVAEKTGNARDLYNRASALAAAVTATWNAATGRDDRHMAAILAACAGDPTPLRAVLDAAHHDTFTAAQLRRRFDHFYVEHAEIIPAATAALLRGDVAGFGAAANASQQQGAALLGNQVPETIALAELATALGASGASAFGAGFGGSVWALVPQGDADAFLAAWRARYAEAFPQRAGDFFVTRAGTSAHRL
ncbi:MAG: galactokinase [Caldilineaceae bacterium]|nr:galactokinase [Caldilineaceae bacterium]